MGLINVKWKGSSVKQDSSNRLVTDNEKTTWNNKANNNHTHTKSDIKDFPSSLPASDVYSWAKASSKPSYSKSEVGLGNVDNTADSAKSVKYATSAGNADTVDGLHYNDLLRYKYTDTTIDADGSLLSDSIYTVKNIITNGAIDNHSVLINISNVGTPFQLQMPDSDDMYIYRRYYSASSGWSAWQKLNAGYADSANALNWVAGNEIKFTKPSHTTEQDLHFCWSWADNSQVKLIKQYIFDGGDGNPTQVKASQFNGPLNGNASSASSVPWSGVTGKPSTFIPSSHTHTKSQITDFPSSLPASDVYAWAKASTKPSYSKSEIGLGNVDNTADSVKNVAMATKLQTYKSDSTTETYGTDYPLFAQWDSNGKTVNMVCKGYTVRVQSAATADSADRSNYLSGHDCKPSDSHPGHGAEIFYSWDIGQVENESKGFSVGITIGANPGDSAYGFQIVQNLWDDRTYTRRYNNGEWQKWRMLAWLSDIPTSLPASDVYAWAKASSKPSYTWDEITSKPSTFTPSSHTHNAIQDINNNQNVTFAYSKAGMDYGDYTWLAAWNGEELRAVTKGQFATASHTHTKSQITDFPTSLKNPYSLSITVDGGDTGAASADVYDGSSAKSISVSSSTHNHDLTYLKLTGGTLTDALYIKMSLMVQVINIRCLLELIFQLPLQKIVMVGLYHLYLH